MWWVVVGVIGGAADAAHPAVGVLGGAGPCGGSLIAPRVVLTAAHCANAREAVFDQVHALVTARSAHPAADLLVGDLAVLTLDRDIQVAPFSLHTSALRSGDAVTFVSGEKLSADTHVSAVESTTWRVDGLPNACAGDVGGALLSGGQLAGVISRADGDCGTPTHSVRVDRFASWIQTAAGLAVDADAPPTLTASLPEHVPLDLDFRWSGSDDVVYYSLQLDDARAVLLAETSQHLALRPGAHKLRLQAFDGLGQSAVAELHVSAGSGCAVATADASWVAAVLALGRWALSLAGRRRGHGVASGSSLRAVRASSLRTLVRRNE